MPRLYGLIAAFAFCAVAGGCKSADLGISSYFPSLGTSAASDDADLPSPKATMQAEMPAVEGSWDGPT